MYELSITIMEETYKPNGITPIMVIKPLVYKFSPVTAEEAKVHFESIPKLFPDVKEFYFTLRRK